MEEINFVQEIASHVIWNVRLRCLLDGGECITKEQAVSHSECSLGKWMYSEGLVKYGEIAEMKELDNVHREMHSLVARIIALKDGDDTDHVKKELDELRLLNEKIIFLLYAIQGKMKHLS
jgi:methyl-accepting chemotaxis protein